MKTLILTVSVSFFISKAYADTEQMRAMPILKSSRTYTVPSKAAGEDLQDQRGFGEKESEVGMMNLMMVEGSGYEGMDMTPLNLNGKKTAQAKSTSTSKGASMPGMDMGENHSLPHPASEKPTPSLSVELRKSPITAKIGPNVYEFVIKDAEGKDVKGLKPGAQVYMLSMDMGTASPRVREVKPGLYQTKAVFSMSGPWALKITNEASEKLIEVKVEK